MFPFSSAKKMAPITLNPTLCSTAKYPLRHQGIGEALTLRVGVRRLTGLNVQTSLAEQLNSIAGEEEKTNMKIHPWSEMFQRITEQGDVCQAYIQNTWEVFEESLDDWAPTGAFKNGLSPEVRFDGRGKVGKRDSMTRLFETERVCVFVSGGLGDRAEKCSITSSCWADGLGSTRHVCLFTGRGVPVWHKHKLDLHWFWFLEFGKVSPMEKSKVHEKCMKVSALTQTQKSFCHFRCYAKCIVVSSHACHDLTNL